MLGPISAMSFFEAPKTLREFSSSVLQRLGIITAIYLATIKLVVVLEKKLDMEFLVYENVITGMKINILTQKLDTLKGFTYAVKVILPLVILGTSIQWICVSLSKNKQDK